MVTGDIRYDQIPNGASKKPDASQEKREQPKRELTLAQPVDRVAAFVADLIIFLPIMAVAIAPFRRQAIEAQLSGREDAWAFAAFMGAGFALFAFIAYQTFFLTLWSATPGKRVLGLRVEPLWGPGEKPRAFHALVRSLAFCFELLLLGIPWVAIFGNERRRSLHDRMADTIVVTKGVRTSGPPTLAEASMASGVVAAALTSLSLVITFQLLSFTSGASSEKLIADLEESGTLCEEVGASFRDWVPSRGGKKPSRLEVAVTLFQAEAVNEECLKSEAEFALWKKTDELPLAYLARGLAEMDKEEVAEAYMSKVCETALDSDACRAANLLNVAMKASTEAEEDSVDAKVAEAQKETEVDAIIAKIDENSAPYLNVLAIQHLDQKPKDNRLLDLVENFPPQQILGPFMASIRAKALWSLDRKDEARIAMRSSIEAFESTSRVELARWFCAAEISENGCSGQTEKTCGYLGSAVEHHEEWLADGRIAAAYLRAESCGERLTAERLDQLQEKMGDSEAKAYVKALAHMAREKREGAVAILKDLATRPESAGPFFIEANARLTELASSTEELSSVREAWWEADPGDEGWSFLGRRLIERYNALRAWEKALEVGFKLAENDAIDQKIARSMVVAAYRAGQPRLAAGFLQDLVLKGREVTHPEPAAPEERLPASVDGFEEVVRQLIQENERVPGKGEK